MTPLTFILRGLVHYRRIHIAVALGVAAATAVLTGALLVGDSVRGSLRHLALDRLGRIDHVLVTDRFFRAEMASDLEAASEFKDNFASVTPTILIPGGTIERQNSEQKGRAANILIVGGDKRFWKLGAPSIVPSGGAPKPGEVVLNQPLADELGVKLGDEVLLRLPRGNQVPADSPLGRKEDRIQALAGLKIVAIIPGESLGRFALRSSQQSPRNAYVALESLQNALELPGKVNSLLVAEINGDTPQRGAEDKLRTLLRPTFDDLGFSVQHVRATYRESKTADEQTAFEYFSFTSDRLMIEPPADRVAVKAFEPLQASPVLTYLATAIENTAPPTDPAMAKISVPYSTVTALPNLAGMNLSVGDPARSIEQLADDEVVLTDWTAKRLSAKLGDKIALKFFEPETTHGQAIESQAEFKLLAIAPLTEPETGFRRRRPAEFKLRPTPFNDPNLTPTVEGVTDQDSIDAWDPPFPFDQKRVRDEDETYWELFRTTPKAYVSLAAGRKLWGSRFGQTTSYRIPSQAAADADAIKTKFMDAVRADSATLGFDFIPVKRRALDASSGTTPFDGLFLGLSFFIITAALLLVALLFRLGVEQRAVELGTLLAIGFPQRKAAKLFTWEGLVVAALGGLAGVAGGVGYAWLMLAGLRTWWVGAIATPFLQLHITTKSLAIGYLSGVVTSALVIAWTVRGSRLIPVRQLMSGRWEATRLGGTAARRSWTRHIGWILFALAVVLTLSATGLSGEAQAGCFVGAGMMLLGALLVAIWRKLRGDSISPSDANLHLASLAVRNAGRNAARSTLTIGLMAIATFLIVALSAFRLDPSQRGTGGFDLIGESSQPIFGDLNSDAKRNELFSKTKSQLDGTAILALRLKPGDDASCSNLYQATQPRVIGVPADFIAHFDTPREVTFDFAASAARDDADRANPWRMLAQSPTADAIPVVIDKNTALYSLHLYGGIGEKFSVTYEDGSRATFQVKGLLANSVLQGSLLIAESEFQRLFPQISGHRFFLIQSAVGKSADVSRLLEERLSDEGFDAVASRDILSNLLAVQNTYLSTFQSLGALGLLLGTFGLATVQLRNVFERRRELALLRATGFAAGRLGQMVLAEHSLLLGAGLGVGVFAALVAVIPHMLVGGASLPWRDLIAMLAAIVVVGLLTGLAAVRATVRSPLINTLRGEAS